jgi:two-component system, chemotaxis family, protein-glutamate methylesterase/glutaminase
MKPLRVLVVDDSAYNRRMLVEILSAIPGVEVIGRAGDGDEALRLIGEIEPDLITLDLEMPRMDGFTFLRFLMARRPTPVIVVSGYSAKENVFRALELGALDFVAKPARSVTSDLGSIRDELAQKVELVRHLSPTGISFANRGSLGGGRTATQVFQIPRATPPPPRADSTEIPIKRLVVIGASTGGPTALLEIFARFPAVSRAAVVVAQHMPERFTKTFAERLDRLGATQVREASDVHALRSGEAWICPGGKCVEVAKAGTDFQLRVVAPAASDRYVPSVDRLFATAAKALGPKTLGVILTGMGDDGSEGARAVHEGGGRVIAEAPETAVIYGMPAAAVRTGFVERSLPLKDLAEYVASVLT